MTKKTARKPSEKKRNAQDATLRNVTVSRGMEKWLKTRLKGTENRIRWVDARCTAIEDKLGIPTVPFPGPSVAILND